MDIEHGKIIAEAERLIGKHIYFDVVSVGATINVMMAASMAEGLTILENVAKEPHVVDVANFLNSMGANIKVEGNSATIEGVEKVSAARVSAPDLRAGAALCIAGLATDGITIVDDIVYIQRGYERFEEKSFSHIKKEPDMYCQTLSSRSFRSVPYVFVVVHLLKY